MPRDKTQSHSRIIEAAKREFMEYGFADASLRRIASKAGIQVGGLYKHFSSKEEMFDTLVKPAIDAFYALYHEIENDYFAETDNHTELKPGDGQKGVYQGWESKSEATRMMQVICDHLDDFRLLMTKSQGSKYEDFIHEVSKLEEDATLRYLEDLKKRGHPVKEFDLNDFHLLTSSYIESFFQPVIHGLDKEEALHYAAVLEEFYSPAWKAWLGI